MRILVTGAGALLGQGILRSIKLSAIDTYVIAVDPSPLAAGLYWADRAHHVPMASDPSYLQVLRKIIRDEAPDVILIGTDTELPIFAAHRAQLEHETSVRVIVSNSAVVAIANDKYATYQFLKKHGFAFPKSALANDVAALIEDVGFPVIVKPRVGARSVGVHLVHSQIGLDEALQDRSDMVIQEVAGPENREYTAGVVCFEGKCSAAIVMRRDLRDGNTYRAFVDTSKELTKAVIQLGEALNPHGPANFQFRTDEHGTPRVFEINGRFSGTTPLRALCGFNEVEMCIEHVVHGKPISQPQIQQNTILRHWSETVVPNDQLLDFQARTDSE